MKPNYLVVAEQAVAEKQRELRELTARGLNPDTLASEKRDTDKQIVDTERQLSQLERQRDKFAAIHEAKDRIGGYGATAHGSLYSESVYRPDDRSLSFVADMFNAKYNGSVEAQERLSRNQRQVIDEMVTRGDVTTGDPGLTGLVPPAYIQDQLATYARPARPFADAIGSRPLIEYGMTVSVPRVTTGTQVGVQANEGDAVHEQDPDTDFLTVDVATIAGQVDISRQAFDRSLPNADGVLLADLLADYDRKLDDQLINGLGSSGELVGLRHMSPLSVSYTTGSPTAELAIRAMANAQQKVESTRYLPAEAVLMHVRRWADLRSSFSTDHAVIPLGSSQARAIGSQSGNAGNLFDLEVVKDPNVPTNVGTGTNEDEIFVVRLSDLLLYESPVRQFRFMEALSGTLQVRLQCYAYAAFFPHRWQSSVCMVTGTGLVTPSGF